MDLVWFGVTMTLALIVAVMESLLCRTYCITWPPPCLHPFQDGHPVESTEYTKPGRYPLTQRIKTHFEVQFMLQPNSPNFQMTTFMAKNVFLVFGMNKLTYEYKKMQKLKSLVDLQCKCVMLDTPRIGLFWRPKP